MNSGSIEAAAAMDLHEKTGKSRQKISLIPTQLARRYCPD
jgi:hypothetical protein